MRSGHESQRVGRRTLSVAAFALSAAIVAGTFACRPAVPPQRPAGADTDGDGVPDESDLCPDVPEDRDGYEDWDGCPERGRGGTAFGPPSVDGGALLSQADTDGDGIADLNDECPTVPEDRDGFEDDDGCPDLDNDHDHVLDEKDKCPNEPETYNGFEDDDGCPDKGPGLILPIVRKYTMNAVDFDERSSTIRADMATYLDAVAVAINENPGIGKVAIVGHAAPRERHARALADKRAKAVHDALVARGVAPERLRIEAAGHDEPPCSSEGNCSRYRVDFRLGID